MKAGDQPLYVEDFLAVDAGKYSDRYCDKQQEKLY